MQRRTFRVAAVMAALLAASACSRYPTTLVSPSALGVPAPEPASKLELSSVGRLSLSGLVLAPASVVAAGGGNVIAAGGGNVIAAGGGNVVAAGGGNLTGARHVMALGGEVPVAGARVCLADLAGAPLPGYAPVLTDAEGHYSFPALPDQAAYMIVASFRMPGGQDATLRTLGRTGYDEPLKVVSVASTIVTAALTRGGQAPASFNPDMFAAVTATVAATLHDDALPDLSKPESVAAAAQAIATGNAGLGQALSELASKPPAAQAPQPAPAPAAAAAPTFGGGWSSPATPAPSPSPSQAADAAPSEAATPVPDATATPTPEATASAEAQTTASDTTASDTVAPDASAATPTPSPSADPTPQPVASTATTDAGTGDPKGKDDKKKDDKPKDDKPKDDKKAP